MADGLNQARAMRIAEIMTDFRNIQHAIADMRTTPSPEDYNAEGYQLLRQCIAEAQAVLSMPYNGSAVQPRGNAEQEKTQLRQVLMDASIRRFRSRKIQLRASAASRWINARNGLLKGQRPTAAHAPTLNQISSSLRNELLRISDAQVELGLRSTDATQGKWLAEDPSLAMLIQMMRPIR